jgi:hypothetical protein
MPLAISHWPLAPFSCEIGCLSLAASGFWLLAARSVFFMLATYLLSLAFFERKMLPSLLPSTYPSVDSPSFAVGFNRRLKITTIYPRAIALLQDSLLHSFPGFSP